MHDVTSPPDPATTTADGERAAPGRGARDRALYACFLLGGMGTVLLGPLIPEMLPVWGVSRAQAAILFPAQFVSISVGAVVAGLDLRRSLRVGYGMMVLGFLLFASEIWWLAPPAAAVLGIGLGLALPATNLLVAARNPERRGAALSTLNLVWGLGAVGCPLLFALARNRISPLWLAAGLTVAAFLAWLLLLRTLPEDAPGPGTAADLRVDRNGLWLAALLFLYIGAETTAAGWLVALADELSGRTGRASMLVVTAFWVALLGGRLLAPRILRSISERTLHRATATLALAGLGLVVAAGGIPLLLPAAAVTGLGFAPLYPLSVSLISRTTSDSRAGPIFAAGGIGGAVVPWLTAHGAEVVGSLRLAFLLPIAALALHVALERGYRTPGEDNR